MQTAAPVMLAVPSSSRTKVTAEVAEVRRDGIWGKSGRIQARVINVRVGDRLIRMSGTVDDKGVTGTAGVVAAVAFVPIAGFFVTETSANIPAGSGVKAFLDEDLRVAAPAPMPVVAPAATAGSGQ